MHNVILWVIKNPAGQLLGASRRRKRGLAPAVYVSEKKAKVQCPPDCEVAQAILTVLGK